MSTSSLTKMASTPVKQATAAPTESPGTWRHPRLDEITKRQEHSQFSEKNVRSITINIGVLVALLASSTLMQKFFPSAKHWLPESHTVSQYSGLLWKALFVIPVIQILLNLLPLWRKPDELADIPLTAGQRLLLGLPPSSAPPTPGSVYSTPPRYSRTPSISGSSGKRSFSGSPQSNRATPSRSEFGSPFGNSVSNSGNGLKNSTIGSPGSPLLHRAMGGARRSSLGASMGLASPMGASTGSIFGPDSPSPSPANGKRSTLGLNNKWLYEKGRDRRSSGNNWLLS